MPLVQYPCPPGRFGNVTAATSPLCSGQCFDGYECTGGSTAPDAIDCAAGFACVAGIRSPCPPGWYSTSRATTCTPCPDNTYSASAQADSRDRCAPCRQYPGALIQEGSVAGSADCWPGLLSAVASDTYPIVVGFSVGDLVTLTFTKPTTAPAVPVLFTPDVGTVAYTWLRGNTEVVARMVDAGGLEHPIDPSSVRIGVVNVSVVGVASAAWPVAVTPSSLTGPVNGSWGDPASPTIVSAAAVNSGGGAGLDNGDTVVLQFDQAVVGVDVASAAAIARVVALQPPQLSQ